MNRDGCGQNCPLCKGAHSMKRKKGLGVDAGMNKIMVPFAIQGEINTAGSQELCQSCLYCVKDCDTVSRRRPAGLVWSSLERRRQTRLDKAMVCPVVQSLWCSCSFEKLYWLAPYCLKQGGKHNKGSGPCFLLTSSGSWPNLVLPRVALCGVACPIISEMQVWNFYQWHQPLCVTQSPL